MEKAMAALLDAGHSNHSMASKIVDLGGATLDLDVGQYLISKPIVFPPFVGNAQVIRGTLRASDSFPRNASLVMIGSSSCKPVLPDGSPDGQGCCNEFIRLSEIMFDAAHRAAGGVYVARTMGATIGPAFFVGFKDVGVRIDLGHEVMVHQSWFMEYYWTEVAIPLPSYMKDSKSIGVQINGNDHFVSDVIVAGFTHIGVEVNEALNILTGVHTWNNVLGVGIAVNAPQTRLLGCYLDFNALVITDPSQTVVQESFFFGTHAIFKAVHKHTIDWIRFQGNTYATIGPSIELQGHFVGGTSVNIVDDISGWEPSGPPPWGDQNRTQLKLTRARRSLHLNAATKWVFDFSDMLLLPLIEEVSYSITLDAGSSFARHAAREPSGTTVMVETDVPVSGTVVVEVAQAVGKAPDLTLSV